MLNYKKPFQMSYDFKTKIAYIMSLVFVNFGSFLVKIDCKEIGFVSLGIYLFKVDVFI